MLPALARHLKPTLHSFSAGLADHFLLVARLWWAAPPDKLFHLPPSRDYEQHNLGGVTTRLLLLLILFRVVLVCLSHLILLSGLGPVKWQTHSGSDLPLLNQQCDLWLWRRLDPFTFCFFSWDRAMWEPPVWCPWEIWQCKDMIVGLRLRRIDGEHMWDSERRLPPLMLLWYVHKETLKDSQSSLTGIPNKMVCVCAACLWKQIKIILTGAARNVLNLEPQRGEIQQLITPHTKKIPNVPSQCRLKLIQAFSCCVNDKIMFLLLLSDGRRFILSHLFLSYTLSYPSKTFSYTSDTILQTTV